MIIIPNNIKLDWQKVSDDKNFQRLVNHLIALERNLTGLIPSSPYIGADGGFDCLFEGYYPPEEKEGRWSIQAKSTKYKHNEAYKKLKDDVKDELEKAEENDVDHLRIATNAELRPDEHVKNLESLNNGEVETLEIWHRENLDQRILKQPFLRYLFFDKAQHPKFVPYPLYFEHTEKHLLEKFINFERFEDYLEKVTDFLSSPNKNLLNIYAPGGYGKTHFLKKIAQEAEKKFNRQVFFVRGGLRNTEDAIQDELVDDGRQYLIIFDDADKYTDEIKALISSAVHLESVKVIFSTRKSGKDEIQERIRNKSFTRLFEEIEIEDWSQEDLVKLLRESAGEEEVENEEKVVRQYQNPYLVAWIGKRISGASAINLEDVQQEYFDDLIYDSEKLIESTISDKSPVEILTKLASLVPLSQKKSSLEEFSKKIDMSFEKLEEVLSQLEEGGVLRTVGKSYRFDPDMGGDLFLSHILNELPENELSSLFEFAFSLDAKSLFENVAAASRFNDLSSLRSILDGEISSWARDASNTTIRDRRMFLDLAKHIAPLVPDTCLSLLYSYLETEPQEENSEMLSPPSTDKYGPIVKSLLGFGNLRSDLIKFIRKLKERESIEGKYNNYKAEALMARAVAPIHNSAETVKETLTYVEGWLDDINSPKLDLMSSALLEVLNLTHEYTTNPSPVEVKIRHKVVKDTDATREIRDRAISILKNLLSHSSIKARFTGIDVVENLHSEHLPISKEEIPLYEKKTEEMENLIEEIGNLLDSSSEKIIQYKIERFFLRLWAQNEVGANKAAKFLRNFSKDLQYKIFKSMIYSDSHLLEFSEMEEEAPEQDRWSWYIENVKSYRLSDELSESHDVIENLTSSVSENKAKVKLLEELEQSLSLFEQIMNENTRGHSPVLSLWMEQEPDSFKKLREDKELWEKVPKRFQPLIEQILASHHSDFFEKRLEKIKSSPSDFSTKEIESIIKAAAKEENDCRPEDISELIDNGDSRTREVVIHNLSFIYDESQIETLIDLINQTLSKESLLTPNMVRSLSITLLRVDIDSETDLDSQEKRELQNNLLEKLKDIDNFHQHHDARRILDFCLRDVDDCVDFIEYCLYKSKKLRDQKGINYRAVPYNGFKEVQKCINSYSDFNGFAEKVVEWYESDPMWRSFHLKHLMKHLVGLRAKDSDRSFLEGYIIESLENNNLRKGFIAAKFLPLNEDKIQIILSLLNDLLEAHEEEKVREYLGSKSYPEEATFSAVGSIPESWQKRLAIFKKMKQEVEPGQLKEILRERIVSLQDEFEEQVKKEEEILNPKP